MSLKDKIEIAGQTDIGTFRDHNEDTIGSNADIGLAVLADGMGGHRGGEVASAITVSTILEELGSKLKHVTHDENAEKTEYSLESIAVLNAVYEANSNVFNASNENSQYRGMGTTVVVLLFYDNRFTVAHVGDSRLYRLRDGLLEQITSDHSLMQELIDRGFYTPEQARESLNKNLVTRAVGIEETVDVDVLEDAAQVDDIYLLCSDGLTDMIEDEVIKKTILDNSDDLDAAATELIRKSNEAGGKDNISVMLARPVKPFPAPNNLFSRFFELFS